jgi:hypothetical protein
MNLPDRFPSLLLALILSALAAGCTGARQTTSSGTDAGVPASNAEADALLARLRSSYAATPNISVNGDLKVSGATVWYDAIVRGRDSMKITLIGPFGVPLGALSATRDEFLFLNAQEGEALEGRPDRETFGKLLMLELEYDEMVSMLRGELPRFPEPGSYTASLEDDVMHYQVKTPGTLERFSIDAGDATLVAYSRALTVGGNSTEEFSITYKDYNLSLGDRPFPKRGVVDIAGGEQRIMINVEHVRDRIDPDRSCALDLPPGIERRRL